MAVTINGTSGVTTPGVSNSGNETISGTLAVTGAATAGSLQVGGVATNVYPLVSGTAVSASGTSFDFTGIPSWVKRITVMFKGVSTNGSSPVMVQLGDAGGIEATGYSGSVDFVEDNAVGTTFSSGFLIDRALGASDLRTGHMTICAFGSNIWNETSVMSNTLTALLLGAGDKTLSDTLTQVRITTLNGTDTFDAGSVNILYE